MKKTLDELRREYSGRDDELIEFLYGVVAAREKMLVEVEGVMMSLVTAQCNFRISTAKLQDRAYDLERRITDVTGDFGDEYAVTEAEEEEFRKDEAIELRRMASGDERKPSLDEVRFGRVDCCGCCERCRYRSNTVCLIEKRLGSEKPSSAQVKYAERIASVLNVGLPICKRKKSYHRFIAVNVDEFSRRDGRIMS